MSDPIATPSAGPASSWIDRQCDQFERDWQQGRNPRIEDVLASLPPSQRQIMLRELLGVELELRARRGDAVQRSEYQSRFPEDVQLLESFGASFGPEPDATISNGEPGTVPSSATTSTRYRNLAFYRKGGLGELYKAVDDSLHRDTIIKFMHEHCQRDPALMAQFKVEAEITSRLEHPGIVPVYGIGQDWHGRQFYVMRLINGRELKQAIAEYHAAGGPSVRGANNRQLLFNLLEHLVSACNTVAYAHHVGIVHCDLKPANIMIGKYGETFVLDWGLATSFERTSTFFVVSEPTMRPHSAPSGSSSGQRGGTYGYISPEQLCGDGPLGPTSDVYSLGATLYEILTGQAPFNGRDRDVMEQVRTGRFPLPRSLQSGVSRRLEAICLKAMSLLPTARYPTAKHLASDITNYMRDEAIEALPDRWTDRLGRFARRHRGVTAGAFVTILTILVAGGMIDRTRRLADHAEELQIAAEKLWEAEQRSHAAEQLSFTSALDSFEALCRPLANGELNNLDAYRLIVDQIKTFTANYLRSFEKSDSMLLHTGRVYELRGTVYAPTDRVHALDDFRRAEEKYARYSPAAGEELGKQLRLAHVQISQGRLLTQMRDFDAAQSKLEAVVVELDALRKQQPDNQNLLRDLAEAHHVLGEGFLNREGSVDGRATFLLQSQEHFDLSKALREQLAKNSTGEENVNYNRDLARSLGYLGDLYLAQRNVKQAAQSYEDSLARRREIYLRNRRDIEQTFQYSRGLANFGSLELGYLDDLQLALSRLKEAEQLQGDLASDLPQVQAIRRDLASTQNMLAEIYLLSAQDSDSRDELLESGRKAAAAASDLWGDIWKERASEGDGLAGIATSLVLRSLLEDDADASRQLARDAEKQLAEIGPEAKLAYDELFTLALARSLQGQAAPALHALKLAISRGENGVNRWERHRSLGFKTLADDPKLGKEFKELCEEMSNSLIVD